MKLKRILAFAVSLAMVLSIIPAFEITAGAATSTADKWYAVKDAYFNSKTEAVGTGTNEAGLGGGIFAAAGTGWSGGTGSATSNFGSARNAVIGYEIPAGTNPDEIASATLYLHVTSVKQINPGATLGVYQEPVTDWTESNCAKEVFGATSNDANFGTKIGETSPAINVGDSGTVGYNNWVTVDVTDYVKSKADAASTAATPISVRLAAPGGGIGISSRENGDDVVSYISVKYHADVTVNYVTAAGTPLATRTVAAATGDTFTVTNTVNDNYIIIDKTATEDGYIAALISSETATVAASGTTVTAKVKPVYTIKSANLLPDGESIGDWTVGSGTEGDYSTKKLSESTSSNKLSIATDNVHSGKYALKSTDHNWSNGGGHNGYSWYGYNSVTMYADISSVDNTGKKYYFAGAFNPGAAGGTEATIATLTTAGNPTTMQGWQESSTALTNGGVTSYNGSDANGAGKDKLFKNMNGTWNQLEYVLTTDAESKGIAVMFYYLVDCGTSYFDDFMLYEVEDYTEDTTSAYDFKDVIKLPRSTRESLALPAEATLDSSAKATLEWTSSDTTVMGNDGTVINPEQPVDVTLTEKITYNSTTYEVQHTVMVFPSSRKGASYTTGTGVYDIGTENIITNGSFEDNAGNFDTTGWTNHYGETLATDNNYWWQLSSDKGVTGTNETLQQATAIPLGQKALGARWSDNGTATSGNKCTIQTLWRVTQAGSYYLSFYVKMNENVDDAKVVTAYCSSSGTLGSGVPEGAQSYSITNANGKWTKYEFIFDANANDYIGILAYYIGKKSNSGNGNEAVTSFDDFELYTATDISHKVYLNILDASGNTVDTLTASGLEGDAITFTGKTFIKDGKYYSFETVNHTISADDTQNTLSVTATQLYTERTAASSVFTYDFYEGVTKYADEGDGDKHGFGELPAKSGAYAIGWGNFRQTIMTFPMPKVDGKAVTAATLHVDVGWTDNATASYRVYAIDPKYVDIANRTITPAMTGYAWEQRADAMVALGAITVAKDTVSGAKSGGGVANNCDGSDSWNEIEIDLTGVMEYDTLALLIASTNQVYTYTDLDVEKAPYLTNIVSRTYDYNNYSLGGYIMKNNVGYNTPLSEIFMLGAHDSMTNYDEMTEIVDPGQKITADGATSLGGKEYYATQVSDIITLLNSGVRYIDVRLTRGKKGNPDALLDSNKGTSQDADEETKWYATHTKVAGLFGKEDGTGDGFAQEIVNWLHDNPGEILIFDLQWVYDHLATTDANGNTLDEGQKGIGNQASYDSIRLVLENTKDVDGKSLYSYIYDATGKHPSEITYGQVTSNGMVSRMVGFSKDISPNRSTGQSAAIDKFMWRGWFFNGIYNDGGAVNSNATLWSEWPNTSSSDTVVTSLESYTQTRNGAKDSYANKLRVMQGVINTVVGGLVKMTDKAYKHNPFIYNQTNFRTWLDAMPIFMVDYANLGANYQTGEYAKYNDPRVGNSSYNQSQTTNTWTTEINNADRAFNPTVITDLARFNRAKKFNFSDYTVDHDITFTDENSGAMVTGKNFELPVSINLSVTASDTTAADPTTAGDGSNVVSVFGKYRVVFDRFERDTQGMNEVTEVGADVTVAFSHVLTDETNRLAIFELDETAGTWSELDTTYANGVAKATAATQTLGKTYLIAEVENQKVNLVVEYVDADNTANVLKAEPLKSYVDGAAVAETSGSDYYFEGDNNAYIVKDTSGKTSYTTADAVKAEGAEYGTVTIKLTVVHKNAAVADTFANRTADVNNNTTNLVFAGAASSADHGYSQADYKDADGNQTTSRGENEAAVSFPRVGLISFKVPEVKAGQAVVLNAYFAYINGNLGQDAWLRPVVIPQSGKIEETVGYYSKDYNYESGKGSWALTTISQSGTEVYKGVNATNETDFTKFDVTEAVKAAYDAGDEYITFRFYVRTAGAYVADRESALIGGSIHTNEEERVNVDFQGKAAFLDVVDGYTVDITDASAVTKNGSAVEVTNNQASIILSTGGRVNLTAADGTAAFVDGSNNLYKLTNGKAEIKNIGSSIVLSGIGAGVSLVDGAQVRVGQGVYDYNGLGYKVTIDGTGSTDPTLAASGLRFIGLVDTVGLASYKATDNTITVGIEIAAKNADGTYTAAVDIPADRFQDPGTEKVFTAAIVNLNEGNYNRIFKATPYVMANGAKYYGNSVLRSVYEIAAGILVTQTVDGSTDVPVDVTERVNRVLNAYVNQVGIRLELTGDTTAPIGVRSSGNTGAYQGGKDGGPTIFFDVTSSKIDDTTYEATITTTSKNAAQIFGYWNEYIRLNNQKLADYIVTDGTTLSEDGKTLTLKISTAKQTAAAAE